jgi:hypothetical protein
MGVMVHTFKIDETLAPRSVSLVPAKTETDALNAVKQKHPELDQRLIGRSDGLWVYLNYEPTSREVTTASGEGEVGDAD